MSVLAKLPRKGLKLAHINICSLRNKLAEITDVLITNNIHILAITETHLDNTFPDNAVNIQGYNVYRKDRDSHGGGTALYIQSHIPAKIRHDLMPDGVEALWLQVHLPYVKPLLVGCCYRPPSANSLYLSELCDMIDRVCDSGNEIYLMADLNLNWLSQDCPLKSKVLNVTNACYLSQVINQPTRIFMNSSGKKTSTCIDHIFTNAVDKCSKGISVPIGCSDHNLIAIVRKAKVPKGNPKVVNKRSYKTFNQESFCTDVNNLCWSDVYKENHPDDAIKAFVNIFYPVLDKHAPIKKYTVKNVKAPWIDNELRSLMADRDVAKGTAIKTGNKDDWETYCKLRNQVTKINRKNKKMFFKLKINECKYDGKKLWSTLNDVMGRKPSQTPSFIDAGDSFLTKPHTIANYFNDFFVNKVDTLRK